jgi:5'-deoxynucleotidase YfbR-like HD superfamily hydrolase
MRHGQVQDLYEKVFQLKRIQRSGWVNHGIVSPESVADHSYALSILSLSLADGLNLNREKVLLMSLLHDLGESIIGDIITPQNESEVKLKFEAEVKAIKKVLENLDSSDELMELWLDFEHGRTKEGLFVKELDKIEMCLQALAYEKEQDKDLTEFFAHTEKKLTIPELKDIFKEIESSRPPAKEG